MRVFTNLIHGYYKTFVIISVELCDLSQKLKYQFGLLYSFRVIEIFRSSKADRKYVLKEKQPSMCTRPVPYGRPPDGIRQRRFSPRVRVASRRCLLLF